LGIRWSRYGCASSDLGADDQTVVEWQTNAKEMDRSLGGTRGFNHKWFVINSRLMRGLVCFVGIRGIHIVFIKTKGWVYYIGDLINIWEKVLSRNYIIKLKINMKWDGRSGYFPKDNVKCNICAYALYLG